jgi:hypothetical protein
MKLFILKGHALLRLAHSRLIINGLPRKILAIQHQNSFQQTIAISNSSSHKVLKLTPSLGKFDYTIIALAKLANCGMMHGNHASVCGEGQFRE